VKVDGADETVELVRGAGGEMTSIHPVDLGDPAGARAWIEQGLAEAGGIDILYNNAGAVKFNLVPDVQPDDWSFTLRNELDLVFWTTQAAWPHLIERGGGAIVNTASTSGLRGHALIGQAAHASAKAGLVALTAQLAAEGATHRIRANSICPGGVETPALQAARSAGILPLVPQPLGRIGKPEDIANCALYLASDEASWVTGANFVVDGGMTMIDGVEPQSM
jgi:NAD(P)-dependent dehydrogenase (short-subunit alcohol dehydrogenase family)